MVRTEDDAPIKIPALVEKVMRLVAEIAEETSMRGFRGSADIPVIWKSDGTPLTDVDAAAEVRITEELLRLLPGSQVLGEETAGPGDSWKRSPLLDAKGDLWIVDPIDGTAYFAQKLPFGSIVGLRQNGQMTMCVVYYPVEQECIWASHERPRAYLTSMKDGPIGETRALSIPQVSMKDMEFGFYMGMDGKGNIRDIVGEAALSQFGKGPVLSLCIATSLRRMLTKGDHAFMNGISYAPWDFETTAFIARRLGAVVTHRSGKPCATTPQSTDAIFAPTPVVSAVIHQGLKVKVAD